MKNNEHKTGRGPAGECLCKSCTVWSPLFKRINEKLSDEDKKLFDDFIGEAYQDSDDVCYYKSCLDGSWPDWEFMKHKVKWKKIYDERVDTGLFDSLDI